MNNAQYTIRVGLFFLLGLALIWVTYETLGNTSRLKKQGYMLVAGFDNLKELKAGDDIRMAGVRIGAVETTRLANRRAEAVLRIEKTVVISGDATATIVAAGLLGTNYISIDLGSPTVPPLTAGSEIRTVASPDLNTIMTQLGELGNKLDGALGSIGDVFKGQDGKPGMIQRLDNLINENSEKVNNTITGLQEITDKINHGDGTLGKLVNDPALHDQLLATVTELKGVADDARGFVTNAQILVDKVKSGEGTLGALIYDDQTGQDLKATMANLRSVSDKLAKGEGTLGKLINDDSLYTGAQSTLKKADRALDGMSDAGPITAVGVVANALF
ncbi:MAG: MlaD family protein [Cephaloticoccus sp.]|nr:MlaD family protein [Cephaloticoccus sp.]